MSSCIFPPLFTMGSIIGSFPPLLPHTLMAKMKLYIGKGQGTQGEGG